MEEIFFDLIKEVLGGLLGALLAIAASAVAYAVHTRRRYGGWVLKVRIPDRDPALYALGTEMSRTWLRDPWSLRIGLKSAVADSGRFLQIDPTTKVVVDRKTKVFLLHLEERDLKQPKG